MKEAGLEYNEFGTNQWPLNASKHGQLFKEWGSPPCMGWKKAILTLHMTCCSKWGAKWHGKSVEERGEESGRISNECWRTWHGVKVALGRRTMLLHILHPDWWLYSFRDSLLLAASTRWRTVEASQITRNKYIQRIKGNYINNSTSAHSCFIEQIHSAPFIHKHDVQEWCLTLTECQSGCNAGSFIQHRVLMLVVKNDPSRGRMLRFPKRLESSGNQSNNLHWRDGFKMLPKAR